MKSKASEMSIQLKKGALVDFFEPRTIAVVGFMKDSVRGGYAVIKNLLEAGFKGKIYPVDPSRSEILGLKVYTAIKNVPGKIDLTLIIVDCETVPSVITECVEKGVKAVIILSGGFAERNDEELVLQKDIVKIARQSGMRIIGPDTAGIINTRNDLICCPYIMGQGKIRRGGIALCSENRMIGAHTFPYADLHYGVSKICDLGNKSDVDESDMLEYLENDLSTKVIAMHIEKIRDGRRFLEIARRATSQKPVLVLKSRRTNRGGLVSTPQTSSPLLDGQITDAVCKQVGIIPLEKAGELFEVPKIFAYQPLPKGNRLAIVSHTGMAGTLAADEGAKYGLSIAKFSPETRAKLNAIFPDLGKTIVDVGPFSSVNNDYISFFPEILKAVLADYNVDCLIHIIWAAPVGASVENYRKIYSELRMVCQKPIAIWVYGPRLSLINNMTDRLEDLGFPVFSDLETGIKAIGVAYQYAIWKKGEA